MNLIIRKFEVMRGERKIVYPFTTYSCIFDADKLPDSMPKTLQNYLKQVFMCGVPPNLTKSVSSLPHLVVETKEIESSLVSMALEANYRGLRHKQHECVQNYLLAHDPDTIAIEVPVWDEDTLGHIDIIRLGPKIGVWDFKPEARKEKKAGGQVLRYIAFLSKLLKLPLREFEGGYYDDKNCYSIIF